MGFNVFTVNQRTGESKCRYALFFRADAEARAWGLAKSYKHIEVRNHDGKVVYTVRDGQGYEGPYDPERALPNPQPTRARNVDRLPRYKYNK